MKLSKRERSLKLVGLELLRSNWVLRRSKQKPRNWKKKAEKLLQKQRLLIVLPKRRHKKNAPRKFTKQKFRKRKKKRNRNG